MQLAGSVESSPVVQENLTKPFVFHNGPQTKR